MPIDPWHVDPLTRWPFSEPRHVPGGKPHAAAFRRDGVGDESEQLGVEVGYGGGVVVFQPMVSLVSTIKTQQLSKIFEHELSYHEGPRWVIHVSRWFTNSFFYRRYPISDGSIKPHNWRAPPSRYLSWFITIGFKHHFTPRIGLENMNSKSMDKIPMNANNLSHCNSARYP